MSGPLQTARGALAGTEAWVVGGAVRDRLLGRATADFDLVVAGDLRGHARALARSLQGAAAFPLSEAFGAWRVIGPARDWNVDLSPLEGRIEDDLARRDFTVNALAQPLAGGEVLDLFDGRAHLAARRLALVSPEALAADPLRALRLARLTCELGFEPDPEARASAREHAPRLAEVSPERVFAELKRIVGGEDPLRGLTQMDELGLTAVVLPELEPLRDVQQSDYHHLDVHAHTLAVLRELVELERDPAAALGEHAGAAADLLAEPLADDLTRGQALRFGALLHDAAKPQTRALSVEGRVTFLGHDEQGAELARGALARLRASERLRAYVATVTRHHLRLGFLVHRRPLSRRDVHRYLRACEPLAADVTILSVADRLATRGRNAEPAIAAHLEVARELLGQALAWRSGPPAPLVRGDDLADELGLEPGPELGRLLDALAEAQFAGEVRDRAGAVRLARSLAQRTGPAAG